MYKGRLKKLAHETNSTVQKQEIGILKLMIPSPPSGKGPILSYQQHSNNAVRPVTPSKCGSCPHLRTLVRSWENNYVVK